MRTILTVVISMGVGAIIGWYIFKYQLIVATINLRKQNEKLEQDIQLLEYCNKAEIQNNKVS